MLGLRLGLTLALTDLIKYKLIAKCDSSEVVELLSLSSNILHPRYNQGKEKMSNHLYVYICAN